MQDKQKKHHKLFIATPAYGHQVTTYYAESLFRLMSSPQPEDFTFTFHVHLEPGVSLVTFARNNCVAEFLKSDCDKLLFIDADIGFTPEAVHRLLRFDDDVVLCPYPVKELRNEGTETTFVIRLKDKENIRIDKEGFTEITAGPAGFMMIDRKVFEKMDEAYPEKKTFQMVRDKKVEEFWYTFFETDTDPVMGYLGEDLAFCNLWTKIGGRIYADTQTALIHYGGIPFHDSLDIIFKRGDMKFKAKTVDDIRKQGWSTP